MSRKPVQRVAFVKLTPGGTSYAMRCDRLDLGVGDSVEVEMYAGTKRAYFDSGEITAVEWHRWNCSCHVLNHAEEVFYRIEDTDGFAMVRTVDLSKRATTVACDRRRWDSRRVNPQGSAESDLRSIYDSITHEQGEDTYLSDGVWMRPDGSLDDRGR